MEKEEREDGKTLANIKFAHRVITPESLVKAAANPEIDVIEADIIFSKNKRIPVMGHPPATDSEFTFDAWFERASNSDKGLKLDFKDPRVVEYCIEKLLEKSLKQQIFLNADILRGPGGVVPKFTDPKTFIEVCKKTYSQGILSVGWTTQCFPDKKYTAEYVKEMLSLVNGVAGKTTFPVRAYYVQKSWENLQKLIENPNHTLTIWNNEPVDKDFIQWLIDTVDPKKAYIDLVNPDDMSPISVF